MISSPTRRRFAVATVLSVVLGTAGALVIAAPASADTFPVDSLTDDGVGNTLREAVALANANPGHDTIEFAASLANSTLQLNDTIEIIDGVTITGLGSGQLTVARTAGDFTLFQFIPGLGANLDLVVSGLTFKGDSGGGYGAAIYVADARNVSVDDISVVNAINSAGAGMALSFIGGAVTVTNSSFEGNTATDAGGAIYVNRADTVSVSATDFSSNNAGASGGAVLLDNIATSVAVDGGIWSVNEAVQSGGALRLTRSAILATPAVTITGGEFKGNASTAASGGAVSIGFAGAVTVDRGEYRDNDANGNGGGLDIAGASASITGATFFSNRAHTLRGGGLFTQTIGGATQVIDCVFEENSSGVDSGALHLFNSAGFTVSGSDFLGNSAPVAGAVGVGTLGGPSTITDSLFDGNSAAGAATSEGGAISFQSTVDQTVSISRSTFNGNTALTGPNARGGAIHAFWVTGSLAVSDSTFEDNEVGQGGGGVSVAVSGNGLEGVFEISNSTFDEPNSTTATVDAAMVYIDAVQGSGTAILEHSTFTGDYVFRTPFQGGTALLSHVLVDADPAENPVTLGGGSPIDVEWSLFTTTEPASVDSTNTLYEVADLKLGPLQNNGGPTDTRLPLAGSPAIDKGNPAAAGLPAFDQRGAGFDRVQHFIVDVGAVEVPFALPATGQSVNLIVPIAGGVLLLAGIVALVVARVRRKGSHSA